MAIGVSTQSPSLTGFSARQGGAIQDPAGVPVGLRGSVSLGSGLRTGVTVVERAIQTSAELGEARERAREALAEQARLESEAAEAERAARREELRAQPTETAPATSPPQTTAPAPGADGESNRQTIEAAVAAGEAGEETPRGAFVDFSI